MASMRDWLKGPRTETGRVVVVHCKAGKGRSGTVATSYLVSEEAWSVEDAMLRFTARRMRNGFGSGISIPSQIRWVRYVDWWAKHGKVYVERQIEIMELHVWGLRDGVKVAVEGYVDGGRVITAFHTFTRHEKTIVDDTAPEDFRPAADTPTSSEKALPLHESKPLAEPSEVLTPSSPTSNLASSSTTSPCEPGAAAALFRPSHPLILPTSDINIDFERRNKAKYGLTMVTSVAHVWFNAFFESHYTSGQTISDGSPRMSNRTRTHIPSPTDPPSCGVFSIDWDAMDGIKGSARKGIRALDRLSVVWRALPVHSPVSPSEHPSKIITEPKPGEPIPDTGPSYQDKSLHLSPSDAPKAKNLGLRSQTPSSVSVSRASSFVSVKDPAEDYDSEAEFRNHGPKGKQYVSPPTQRNLGTGYRKNEAHVEDSPNSTECWPGEITRN